MHSLHDPPTKSEKTFSKHLHIYPFQLQEPTKIHDSLRILACNAYCKTDYYIWSCNAWHRWSYLVISVSKLIVMSKSSLEGPILRGEVFKQVMSHVHIVIIIMSLMPPWRTVVWHALQQRQGAVQRNTSIYNENNKKIYHLSDCKIIHAYIVVHTN